MQSHVLTERLEKKEADSINFLMCKIVLNYCFEGMFKASCNFSLLFSVTLLWLCSVRMCLLKSPSIVHA